MKEAIANDIQVCCLPGATAFVPVLAASGLPSEQFCFLGFMPEKQKDQSHLLHRVLSYPETLIFYEAPHRLTKSLETWLSIFGDRNIVVGREISKIYETYYRGKISDLLDDASGMVLKGEFVVLVSGAGSTIITNEDIEKLLEDLLSNGLSQSDVIRQVSELTGVKKNRIYELALISRFQKGP